MANKEISDLTEFTTKPADGDVFAMEDISAEVTRKITWLNLLRDRWETKITTYTAVKHDKILANTTAGAFTVKLPASPTAGDTVEFKDSHGKWNTSNLTVDRNGSNIRAAASNYTGSTQWATVKFVYVDATAGWHYSEY